MANLQFIAIPILNKAPDKPTNFYLDEFQYELIYLYIYIPKIIYEIKSIIVIFRLRI
ncbi:hypothetical protein CFB3_03150 [Clostridium folliculivorans]|uniref:Uncharacterized protein n=1 Tax=Clostridium folliculivorans TaxID=2886038 RepID=A0A9W5Y421_9CLOT|nr:hypothetical protein CFOLD11_29500 [Clostridium folliculivorans]GKU28209.1 hypothetical protein CFB3_03150 [Clostridium folliculivorans]